MDILLLIRTIFEMDESKSDSRDSPSAFGFETLKKEVLAWMKKGLPKYLRYHSVEHTEDVLDAAVRIAVAEGIEGRDLLDLKVAAVFHDSGFVISSNDHEEASCRLVKKWLPQRGYDAASMERVCAMILATNIPQRPQSHLGEVLCDADLDYLGREDFWPISNRLYEEFLYLGVVQDVDSWNRLQVRFFESHSYFTETARAWRAEKKAAHLEEIRALVEA